MKKEWITRSGPVRPWRAQHLSLWLGPTDVPVLLDLIDTAAAF